jgi:hypothetical protein
VRQPEREEDDVEPLRWGPGEHVGDLEPDVGGGPDSAASDLDCLRGQRRRLSR